SLSISPAWTIDGHSVVQLRQQTCFLRTADERPASASNGWLPGPVSERRYLLICANSMLSLSVRDSPGCTRHANFRAAAQKYCSWISRPIFQRAFTRPAFLCEKLLR